MFNDQLIDPTTKHTTDPFPRQEQPPPGLTEPMAPQPDHGEQSYRGHRVPRALPEPEPHGLIRRHETSGSGRPSGRPLLRRRPRFAPRVVVRDSYQE